MSELKPCPFCGSKAKIDKRVGHLGVPTMTAIYCPKCTQAEHAVATKWYKNDAFRRYGIKAWNRRSS